MEKEEFDKKYGETFFHQEDTKAICSKCKGTKELIKTNYSFGEGTRYWKYKGTTKSCQHKWRKADYK